MISVINSGFTRFLESPGIVFAKFPGLGKSWKMSLVLESHEIVFVKFPGPGKSWKISLVLESTGNLLGNDADADA